MSPEELFDRPVQVIAGTGGVGRTTLAVALALRASRAGYKTLLLEVDAPDSATQALGARPAVDHPREVENNLWMCRMTPAGSLKEYALLILRFKTLYRMVFENRLVRYLLRSIPSLAELTMLGKAWWHATQETDRQRQLRFQRVIIDAPATGHALSFLTVAHTVCEVAPPGVMKDQTQEMALFVESAVLHVVAIPEEMPVNEGLVLFAAVPDRLRMTPGLAVLNRKLPPLLRPQEQKWLDELRAVPELRPYVEAADRRLEREAVEEVQGRRFFEQTRRPGCVVPEIDGATRPAVVEGVVTALESKLGSARTRHSPSPSPILAPRVPAASTGGRRTASNPGEPSPTPSGLNELLESARCLVCVGPGGVGKTSVSAALAIEASRRGRRSVVLTIDPARRLANALGLPEIGSIETDILPQAFVDAGLEPPNGRLTALMLDIKEAWDDVVGRYHPNPERRQRLLDNRLYRALSTALAGSQEYMAMEKLHRLATREEDRPDLIVLDTPPAQHALDFLEAPNRIVDALDNDATRWLLEPRGGPRRLSRKMFDAGSTLFIRTIARFTGIELLDELAELLECFSDMFDGFRVRARAVKALLDRPDTSFCVVGAPTAAGLADAEGFVDGLQERSVRVGAVILNRGTRSPFQEWDEAPARLRHEVGRLGGSTDFAERLERNARRAEERAQRQAQGVRRMSDTFPHCSVVHIPELRQDVHDLESLFELGRYLMLEPARVQTARGA